MALTETILTHLIPDPTARGGWARKVVPTDTDIPKDVPVINGWTSWDPTDPVYRKTGVVIRS